MDTAELLAARLPHLKLLTAADALADYGCDRTTRWHASPSCVVFPESCDDVQAIVRLANEHRFSIVPSGGRTGLSGGAVAGNREVVVSMARMQQIIGFDTAASTVTVQAGVVTRQLQDAAAARGLFYGVDFAAAGSSQIGGNIATNAGGIRVIRYGMTRDQVLGLTVVTGAGDRVECNRGLIKNNTGYDFRHLMIGSEGTLGIICEATLKLQPPPAESKVMLLGTPDFAAVLRIFGRCAAALTLTAFECMSDNGVQRVLAATGLQQPLSAAAPFYVLLEFESTRQSDAAALLLFEKFVDDGLAMDGVLSQSLQQAQTLWRLREEMSSVLHRWQPYKNDISVGISAMPAFIEAADAIVRRQYSDFDVVWYGHIGDGNLHLNVLKPDSMTADEFVGHCEVVSEAIAEQVRQFGGSISAEHGVGLLKKDLLHYSRDKHDIAMMRGVKQVFDPNGVLNPGKIFD